VRDLLYNFHIYSDDQLLRLAQEQRVHIGFTVERLPFGNKFNSQRKLSLIFEITL